MKFTYSVVDKEDDVKYRLEYEDSWTYTPVEMWMVVQDIANHYWNNHDGWDHNHWPLDFFLWNDREEFLGKFEVNMEAEPRFYANRVDN